MSRLIIGITGGIASGKSTFLSIMQEQGFLTISADNIVKELYKKDKKGYQKIIELRLDNILDKEQNIDIKRLRELVFSKPEIKNKIELAIHPLVIKELNKLIKQSDKDKIAIEIPLLFEAKLEKIFSHTVTISAKKGLMIQNIIQRYGIQEKEAEKMLENQMDIEKKVERSTFVLQNNDSYDAFVSKAKALSTAPLRADLE
ncbi:MAG: dephospho-CoA kinase, partial [bacterium]